MMGAPLKQSEESSHEGTVGCFVRLTAAERLHQQQQPAAAEVDDGSGAAEFRHDGGLSGRQPAALQLMTDARAAALLRVGPSS
jgi:hypothetical protein